VVVHLGGPALAIGLSILGVLLRTPPIPTPVEAISGRGSLLVVAFFAVVLGPVFEELLFRGFLQPLLERALGAWPAIVAATSCASAGRNTSGPGSNC
jgi:membrane protease YdiL (CAAX protease family)